MSSLESLFAGAFIGGLISWFITHMYFKKTVKDGELLKELVSNNNHIVFKIHEDVKQLLPLIPDANHKKANEIISDYQSKVNQFTDNAQNTNISLNVKIPTVQINDLTMKCPTCGKKMLSEGYRMTPQGLVWHYRCPEHGLFMGNSIDDMWDE